MTGIHQHEDGEKRNIPLIPPGWGDTPEEFKIKVIQLIKQNLLGSGAPKYDIASPDGTTTPFYPISRAIEWGIITREEIYKTLLPKLKERANGAYLSSMMNKIDQDKIDQEWDPKYLAWGLEQQVFSPEQTQKILANRYSLESYIATFKDERLVEDIINPLVVSDIIKGTKERTESSLERLENNRNHLDRVIGAIFSPNNFNVKQGPLRFHEEVARSLNTLVSKGLWPAREDGSVYIERNSLVSLAEIRKIIGKPEFDEKFPHFHQDIKDILLARHNLSQ